MPFSHATILLKSIFFVFYLVASMLGKVWKTVLVASLLDGQLIYLFIYLFIYSYIFLIKLYWSIIASQHCASFCCTTKRISHMHTHVPMSPTSWASLPWPSRSSQSTEPISLCYAAASHQRTILHSVVYICQCYSHFTQLCPPTPCPQVHFLRLPLYSYPATRFISTILFYFFFDSIYIL